MQKEVQLPVSGSEVHDFNKKRLETVYVSIDSIFIENFKSIKQLNIKLYEGPNVLVGANAAGKTNVLEAIDFLRYAIIEAAGKTPYRPHLPKYWSALDLIYRKDPKLPIRIGLELQYQWPKGYMRKSSKQFSHFKKTSVVFTAEFSYSPAEDTIMLSKISLSIGLDLRTSLEIIDGNKMVLKVPRVNERINKLLLDKFNESQRKHVVIENDRVIYTISSKVDIPYLLKSIAFSEKIIDKPKVRKIEGIDILLPFGPIAYEFDYTLVKTARGTPLRKFLPLNPSPTSMFMLTIPEVLSRIVLLRHPDIGAFSEPRRITGRERLEERARNLPEVLFSYRGRKGEDPPRVRRALKTLFPTISIAPRIVHGNVVLFVEENGLELPPPNIPDGLLKLVSLMLAMDLEPTLLLVDEIENSMHARLIEYVIDEFSSLSIPVLLATHSPTVIDLVGMNRILVVRRDPISGTIVERPSSIKELVSRLESEGITISDHVIYGETYQ